MVENGSCSDVAMFTNAEGFEFFPHLVRLIAEGRPVSLEELAARAQCAPTDLARVLRSQPGAEWDPDGKLVGFGLTLRPTDHHFTLGARELFTWCATDTLLFTVILGERAVTESICPATGEPIWVEIAPDAVVSVSPADAVVSQLNLAELACDLRTEICDHGHFFASATVARTWASQHPNGEVLSVQDAFERCRATCEELDWLGSRGEPR